MNIIDNLFFLERLDYLIRTKSTGNPKELSTRLGVSERTIYRLIKDLQDMGLPITYCRKSKRYFYEKQVKWHFEFLVDEEKIITIKVGDLTLPNFDMKYT